MKLLDKKYLLLYLKIFLEKVFMKSILYLFLALFFCEPALQAKNIQFPTPYLCGRYFADYCDFQLDETHNFDPIAVRHGDKIYVKADHLSFFFSKLHPSIQSKYILITHNCDYSVPGSFASYLDDDKLMGWLGENFVASHPKGGCLPIGLFNSHLMHNHTIEALDKAILEAPHTEKNIMLYMNFMVRGWGEIRYKERLPVEERFKNESYCVMSSPTKEFHDYLNDIAHSKFVLSPAGNGIDCYRTWECILLGAIPIMKRSPIDYIYDDLPVLIIDEWAEIHYDFLSQKYEEIKSKTYNLEKAYLNYWLAVIDAYQS